jgi:hypothetical protein
LAKEIRLAGGHIALVDDCDFDDLSKYFWWLTSNGYAARKGKGRTTIRMHRQVIGVTADRSKLVDHINGNRLDNRRENLRACNKSQNGMNSKTRSDSVSGLKGVTATRGRFSARISVDGRQKYLGSYETAEEAHEVYCLWANMVYGEFFNPGYKRVA